MLAIVFIRRAEAGSCKAVPYRPPQIVVSSIGVKHGLTEDRHLDVTRSLPLARLDYQAFGAIKKGCPMPLPRA